MWLVAGAHGDCNRLLEDMVSQNHIDVDSQKRKNLFYIIFRVLVYAIL